MAAVIDIINQALKDIGVIGDGQTANDEQVTGAFDTLNQMLGQWQVDNLHIYAQKEVVLTLTGAQQYTVGTGGAINIIRPVKIDACFWRKGGIDYPMEVMNAFEDYEQLTFKALGSIPRAVYYLPSYPMGALYVYPQANQGELHLVMRTDLPTYATAADSFALPPEYASAVRYSLGELLAAENSTPLRPDLAGLAKKGRAVLRRANTRIPQLNMPSAVMRNRYFNINGGY